MKKILLICLIVNSALGQTKDISKLTKSEKNQELIETLDWIKSKTGKDFKRNNIAEKVYRYCTFDFDKDNPRLITIKYINFADDSDYRVYTFSLSDISSIWVPVSGQGLMFLHTYSNQRLINLKENNEFFITDEVSINYDNIVSNERMVKALNYAMKLADGGKKILKEKF